MENNLYSGTGLEILLAKVHEMYADYILRSVIDNLKNEHYRNEGELALDSIAETVEDLLFNKSTGIQILNALDNFETELGVERNFTNKVICALRVIINADDPLFRVNDPVLEKVLETVRHCK
jgi:hypothetical protein